MGRIYIVVVCLFFTQASASVQYINTDIRGNCPCQNVAIQRNLPARLPVSTNLPITNNWVATPPNTGIPLPNACPCNRNNAPILKDTLSPQERTVLIANLKNTLSNLLPIVEKLALLSNLALASKNGAANLNVPISKLNVPIVNEVPFGALRVARNLPLSNFLPESPIGVSNNIQVLGKSPINYQNIGEMPVNNLARIALSNFRNVPVNNVLGGVPNMPPNNPGYSVNNIINSNLRTIPLNNILNVPNAPINPGYSLNDVINKNIERQFLLSRPPCNNFPLLNNNVPCNNVPSMTLNNLLERIQTANNLNKLGFPINNINLPVNNLGLPINNQNFRVNTVANPMYNNQPVQKSIRYINRAAPPVVNNRFYEQLPLGSSSNGRVVTNVPVIPYNSLANLPAYNGMPVIKVSESVYRLTPVNNNIF